MLSVESVVFHSQLDEAAYFWCLNKLSCHARGVGRKLLAAVSLSASEDVVRDLLGLFRRYRVDTTLLAVFQDPIRGLARPEDRARSSYGCPRRLGRKLGRQPGDEAGQWPLRQFARIAACYALERRVMKREHEMPAFRVALRPVSRVDRVHPFEPANP
jgi:hypothetical protein